jgi:phage baseplate assembly protein W
VAHEIGVLWNNDFLWNNDLFWNGTLTPELPPVQPETPAGDRDPSHIIEVLQTSRPFGNPHLAVPFRMEGDRVAVVEEDTWDEVAQSVGVILGTFWYERPMVPDFGIESPLFHQVQADPDPETLEGNVETWEERALLEWGDTRVAADGEVQLEVYVEVREA